MNLRLGKEADMHGVCDIPVVRKNPLDNEDVLCTGEYFTCIHMRLGYPLESFWER